MASADGRSTNVTSFRGSRPTDASMLARNTWCVSPSSITATVFPFIANGADPIGPEQLEAADVPTGQHDDGRSPLHPDGQGRDEGHHDVDLPGSQRIRLRNHPLLVLDVLDFGKAFAVEKLLGHVLGRDAEAAPAVGDPDPGRLGGRFGRCPRTRTLRTMP